MKKLTSLILAITMILSFAPQVMADNKENGISRQTVSLGFDHSAAIKTDGTLWTWGRNTFGQLGDGTDINSGTPIKIMDNVVAVSLGANHSAAIKTDGTLWTWGRNTFGQLGNGTDINSGTPIKIMDDVVCVSLSNNYNTELQGNRANLKSHSAAVKTDGSLWTWGWNEYGQLGNGNISYYDETPKKIMDDAVFVSLGEGHSAAIKDDGSLWTWGNNSCGQLGDGTTDDRSTPTKIMDDVASVSLGQWYSMAIKNDGSLWVWGNNYCGQLGDGTIEDKAKPVM